MKRISAFLIALVLVLGVMSSMTASAYLCDTHEWGQWETVYPAECTTPGQKVHYCIRCQEAEYAPIPALGHYFADPWTIIKEPTCTEDGIQYNKCSRRFSHQGDSWACGFEWYTPLTALGHDWSDWYVVEEPVPGKDGWEERKCNRCGITEQNPLHVDGDDDGNHDDGDYDDGDDGTDGSDLVLEVTKSVLNLPANNEHFVEDEQVQYMVSVKNLTDRTLYSIEISDPIRGTNEDAVVAVCEKLDAGETLEAIFFYTVTAADVDTGYIENTAYASWWDEDAGERQRQPSNTVIVLTGGEIVPQGIVYAVKSVVSTPANGEYYTEGETVTFHIEICNERDEAITDIIVLDPLAPGDEAFRADSLGCGCLGGEFDYTVTAEDAETGFITNQAFADWEGFEVNGKTSCFTNEVTVPTMAGDEPVPVTAMSVTKKVLSAPANGMFYTEGETVIYRIDLTCAGEAPAHDATLTDPLMEEDDWFGDFNPGDSGYCVYGHAVTADDVTAGGIWNTASVTYENVLGDNETVYSETVFVPCGEEIGEDHAPTLIKTELSAPANGLFYVEGEEVDYQVDFVNDTGKTLYDVELWDGDLSYVVGTVNDGKCASISYDYTVTADDAAWGSHPNQAYAVWGEAPNVQDRGEVSNIVVVPCGIEEPAPGCVTLMKTVISTPADGAAYCLGETVTYAIVIQNGTDKTITDIDIYDYLCNAVAEQNVLVEHIDSLPAGEGYLTYITHVVNIVDEDSGYIDDRAHAIFFEEGTLGNDDAYSNWISVPVQKGTPVPAEKDEFTVWKYELSIPKNGKYYEVGEDITFVVVVYNDTGITFTDVKGYDILLTDSGYFFGSMPTLDASPAMMYIHYTVTEIDLLLGSVTNVAWVEAKDDDGVTHVVSSNEVTVPVGEGGGYPVIGGSGEACQVYVIAEGDGIESVRTDYCAVHGKLEAESAALLEEGRTGEVLSLWKGALDAEYAVLMRDTDEETAAALKREQQAFGYMTDAWADAMAALGAEEDAVRELLICKYRERVTALCAGKAAYDGKSAKTVDKAEIAAPTLIACEVSIADDAMGNTVTTTLCVAHRAGDNAVRRLASAMEKADDGQKEILKGKMLAARESGLDAAFTKAIDSAEPAAVAKIMRYKILLESEMELRSRALHLLFADDPWAADETVLRMYLTATAELCGTGK